MGKFSSQNSNDNIKAKDMSPKFKLPRVKKREVAF